MRGNVAACPDSMVVQGHLSHSHREEPRLEPRLTHDLLSPVHNALEDSVEWGHPFNFAAARCDREEECTSLEMPPPRSDRHRPRSSLCGLRVFVTTLEHPGTKNYRSRVSGTNELSNHSMEIWRANPFLTGSGRWRVSMGNPCFDDDGEDVRGGFAP